ncbi:MAG: DUF5615 family PIN-like protein [Streptosporangiaceae bacterium]
MRLLLDEMYGDKLPQALRDQGIDVATAAGFGMAGRPDADVLAAAADGGYTLLTETVSDFTQLCAEHLATGRHHFEC